MMCIILGYFNMKRGRIRQIMDKHMKKYHDFYWGPGQDDQMGEGRQRRVTEGVQ